MVESDGRRIISYLRRIAQSSSPPDTQSITVYLRPQSPTNNLIFQKKPRHIGG